ncbi:disulfide-bond oxidoreductase YfcG [Podospora conica]|nr:disulfide-bond oxidoreductase YfcG [Schizothecium conicum]
MGNATGSRGATPLCPRHGDREGIGSGAFVMHSPPRIHCPLPCRYKSPPSPPSPLQFTIPSPMSRRLTLLTTHLARTTTTTTPRTLHTTMASKPPLHLYTQQTPNGIKASILLEELGLPYDVTEIHFSTNEQKEPWFLAINPNGRIPALTDASFEGEPLRVFESGAILNYLVEQYDKEHKVSYPRGTREYWEVQSWLFWQMGGLGPMQGQANHFFRYAPEKIEYGVKRYQGETRRLYSVMEAQLEKSTSGYLVGDKCTVADISCWGWVAAHDWAGVSIEEFPNLKAWLFRMLERPGVEKGRHVPSHHGAFDKLSEEEKEKQAKEASKWVMAGNDHTK